MLQKKELHFLYELDSNYRNTLSRIGKKIRVSEQLVSYKVNFLAKKNIIQNCCPLIDYSRFGYLTFIVYFLRKERKAIIKNYFLTEQF